MTKNQMKVLLKSQQGELDAVAMYNKLADKTRHGDILVSLGEKL